MGKYYATRVYDDVHHGVYIINHHRVGLLRRAFRLPCLFTDENDRRSKNSKFNICSIGSYFPAHSKALTRIITVK